MTHDGSDSRTRQQEQQDDPMDGLDVGETVHVTESKTLHEINYTPMVFFGGDRFGDYRVEDVEILEDEETGGQQIKITWEGELTKRLPRRWYEHNEPVTETEKQQARRRKWAKRVVRGGTTVGVFAFAMWIAIHMTNTVAREMTVNGEPMPVLTILDIAPVLVLVVGLVMLLHIGLKGGFPGKVGGLR